ncbi:hypothetical protein [Desulfofundulus thermosubterraneus]|uniref:Uncharacterized protein n=1 Tax=Desulfofundulus thermosubterraneus DSM 16057 TaxID=1121432 RepID=A0A1M6IDU9_9FIRM|nr:hypothetical protein [Desulfofundulus thermosubterraneus]SHJ32625.1 hypothetical protein SAMN02745219_02293 [Desulfofundulus thermosubterraneus DSM 16057]
MRRKYIHRTETMTAVDGRVAMLGGTGIRPLRGLLLAGLLTLFFCKLAEDVASHELYAFDATSPHTPPDTRVRIQRFTRLDEGLSSLSAMLTGVRKQNAGIQAGANQSVERPCLAGLLDQG